MGFLGHVFSNVARSLTGAVSALVSAPFAASAKKSDPVKYYEAHLGRLSANFALSSDLALALGGRLKFEEMLSGRFADAFGTLYLGYACLWHYQQLAKVTCLCPFFRPLSFPLAASP